MASTDAGRVSVLAANIGDVAEALALLDATDRAGYRDVWFAETNAFDVAALGAAAALRTRMGVGTAIVSAFTRSPAMLASMVATWAGLAGDGRRIALGIGAGGQAMVERWHGVPFDRPVARMEDTVAILRQALAGDRTEHAGTAAASSGYRLASGAVPSARVLIGGMGPRMRSLAAQVADGLIVTWLSPRILTGLRAELDTEARAAGRAPGDVALVSRAYVAVTDDVAAVRAAVRTELVEYLLSPPYARYFASVGFEQEVEDVRRAFEARDRVASSAAVSDALLDEVLVATPDPAEAAALVRRHLEAGADEVLVQPVPPVRHGDPVRTVTLLAGELGDAVGSDDGPRRGP